jgi:hypothetical protein
MHYQIDLIERFYFWPLGLGKKIIQVPDHRDGFDFRSWAGASYSYYASAKLLLVT